MHARATGGGEAEEGYFLLNGGFNAAHKTLAHHRAHAAAHEAELKAGRHEADAVHSAAHHDQGIGLTRVFHGLFQAFGVFTAVFEFQGVDGQHLLTNLETTFAV